MGNTTVTIGTETITLAVPGSISLRYDLLSAGGTNLARAACAALALCWHEPKARKPKARYRFDPLDFGGRVLDELCARGHSPKEVVAAGVLAWNACTEDLIDAAEVEKEEGNSEALEDSTST